MTTSNLVLDLYGCRRSGTRVVIKLACRPNYPVMAVLAIMLTDSKKFGSNLDVLGVQIKKLETLMLQCPIGYWFDVYRLEYSFNYGMV